MEHLSDLVILTLGHNRQFPQNLMLHTAFVGIMALLL